MPGVNLDFSPASEAPEVLGSPDSVCAESGLEEMIGDLLAQEKVEDPEEQFCRKKFEIMLRCAVGEIHCDLQAFGKRVDARLEEATAQVAPLAEAFAKLQEENMRLRIQQEMLVRQVESLCQVMGLAVPSFHVPASKDSSPSILCETAVPANDFPKVSSDTSTCVTQENALETSHDSSSCIPQDSPATLPQGTPASTLEEIPSNPHQEYISCPQDSDSVSTETSTLEAPSPVPHPPTFASLHSLSAPSLIASTSFIEDMVMEESDCQCYCVSCQSHPVNTLLSPLNIIWIQSNIPSSTYPEQS